MVDGRALETDVLSDVCVVGGGPAGIAVARDLEAAGLEVALLVGGGLGVHERDQELNRARQVGIRTDSITDSTVRALGGTSWRWGGWCRPLDALDLEARAEVPDSGWPFGWDELAPYYARAYELCGAVPPGPDPDGVALDSPSLRQVRFRLAAPRRFGPYYEDALARSRRIRVLLDASAVEVEPSLDGRRVVAVRAATLDRRSFRVRARCFVLACGTIQNTRLLLCSRRLSPRGVGNEHGLVGRFFMQHPAHDVALLAFTRRARRAWNAGLAVALAPAVLRREGMLNCHFLLYHGGLGDPPGHLLGRLRENWAQRRHLAAQAPGDAAVGRAIAPLAHAGLARAERVLEYVRLAVRPEQAPAAESRVLIDDADRDELGMPRAVIDWRLGPQDWSSAEKAARLVAAGIGAAGLGRVRAAAGFAGLAPPDRIHGGHHHYGTTRMHTDPRRGVVDADCRVHGVENLFIAGGSVFPTTGFANPMLTLLALASRLSTHIVDRGLGRGAPLAS